MSKQHAEVLLQICPELLNVFRRAAVRPGNGREVIKMALNVLDEEPRLLVRFAGVVVLLETDNKRVLVVWHVSSFCRLTIILSDNRNLSDLHPYCKPLSMAMHGIYAGELLRTHAARAGCHKGCNDNCI